MGYIKKLKNNELVGGTDKITIYPVTSTKAVFEEVSDDEFKSQEYLNNHITNERIVDNTIENRKLKDDTIDMGKLNTPLKTIIQNAYDASWKVKEEPFSLETKYDANDVVYDPDTNSSYVSLTADNQGNPVNPEDEGYVEGKWRIIINGISAIQATEVIEETVAELNDKFDTLEGNVDNAIDGLDGRVNEIRDDLTNLTAYETASSPSYDTQIPLKNLASTAQVGYYFCTVDEDAAIKQLSNATASNVAVSQIGAFSLPPSGGHFKVKMSNANTSESAIKLRFGTVSATEKPLWYNGEPVSPSNTWEKDEIISVYYDGTYYQASNAMGGGSAVGKKRLYGTTGYIINLNGLEIGDTVPSATQNQNGCYIEKSIKEGDVIGITAQGGFGARAWAFIDNQRHLLSVSEPGIMCEDTVIVAPEDADKIILNATIDGVSGYPNYEWYYGKAGSTGAYEILSEGYLYSNLKTLAVGKEYSKGEPVKTEEGQLLRISKEIKAINLKDEIVAGDLRTDGSNTYQAIKTVSLFDETSSDYTAGDYAIINRKLNIYDGSEWSEVSSLESYTSDTAMWKAKDAEWLANNIAQQNSISQDIKAATTWNGDELFDISTITVTTNNGTYITPSKGSDYVMWTVKQVPSNPQTGRQGHFPLPQLVNGKQYLLEFNYENTINGTVLVQLSRYDSQTSTGIATKPIEDVGIIPAKVSGKISYVFTYIGNWEGYLAFYFTLPTKNQYIKVSDISIREVSSSTEAIQQTLENKDDLDKIVLKKGTLTDISEMISESNADNTALSSGQWITNANRLSVFLKVNFVPGVGKLHIAWADANLQCAVQMFDSISNINAVKPYAGLSGQGHLKYNSNYLSAGDYIFNIPENIFVICLQTTATTFSSLMNLLTALEVTIADSDTPNNNEYLAGLVNAVKTPPTKSIVYPYTGVRPNLFPTTNTFYIEQGFELNRSNNGVQGATIFGDYLFHFSSSGYVEVYNFSTGTYLAKVNLPSHSTALDHYDTVCFGNQRYDYNDEFPLIYASGTMINATLGDTATPYIKCFRIVHEDDSWEFTLVQTINLPSADVIGSYPDALIDNSDGSMWVMGWDYSTKSLESTNKCIFTKFQVPLFSEGNVTIDYDSMITQVIVTGLHQTQQGLQFYNNQVYVPYGIKSSGQQGIDVVDLQLQKVVTNIDLINTPILEPEAAVIYNGSLYVINQRSTAASPTHVYKIIFY